MNIETYKKEASIKHYTKNEISNTEEKLIEKYFRSPVLDLGCGVGRTTKYLYDKNKVLKCIKKFICQKWF